jgi:hypothetical protein
MKKAARYLAIALLVSAIGYSVVTVAVDSDSPNTVVVSRVPPQELYWARYYFKALPPPEGDFSVEGNRTLRQWFVTAKRIIFSPGAALKLSSQGATPSAPDALLLYANEIVFDGPVPAPVITWEPPVRGLQLLPSGNAVAAGQSQAAAPGLPGPPGADAPTVIVVVAKMTTRTPVTLDFRGQDGGAGLPGVDGVSGTPGASGENAVLHAFDCARGAGRGADGTAGTNGGNGGDGGPGGRGARVFVLVHDESEAKSLLPLLDIHVEGGTGGRGGQPGRGGSGGAPGRGGRSASPWCSGDGPDGNPGPNGAMGATGATGKRGDDGRVYVIVDSEGVLVPRRGFWPWS